MYAREVGDRVLTFGVSGKLIMNALVMYDRETDSLWSQFVGAAVDGPLVGAPLEPLASTFTEWGTWRTLHPDTLLLDQGPASNVDPYGSYYSDASAGVVGETNFDDRLSPKEMVIGVRIGAAARGYPLRYLFDIPVVNDRIGDREVLVVFDAEHVVGTVFSRSVDGRTLTFDLAGAERAAGHPDTVVPLVDRETSTLWSGLTGIAVDGPLSGDRLRQLPSTPVFWFAWSDFYPDGALWTP